MFTVVGNFGPDLDDLFESLLEVCRHDPFFPPDWKAQPCHDDGWGYVTYDGDSIDFKRYKNAIFDSEKPKFNDKGILVVHARKAASGEPIGLLDSHPHHRGNSEYDVYLVHNGSYNKANIAEKLEDTNLSNQPDSEFFLEYLIRQKGTIEEKIAKTLEDADKYDFVKTTNNIFIMSVDKSNGKARLFYYGFSKRDYEYVTMYKVENDKWKAVISSSLLKASRLPKDLKVTKVEQRKLMELT